MSPPEPRGERFPHPRMMAELAEATWKAAERATGRHIYQFVLAALHDIGERRGGAANPYPPEDGYDSLAKHLSTQPRRAPAEGGVVLARPPALTHPVTVMRDAKALLVGLFRAIYESLLHAGTAPARGPVGALLAAEGPRVNELRFLVGVTEAHQRRLREGALMRDFGAQPYYLGLLNRLLALETDPLPPAPGAFALARLYVDFLKCVACAVANGAQERKITVNGWTVRWLFRNFECFPDTGDIEEVFDYLDDDGEAAPAPPPKKRATKPPAGAGEGAEDEAPPPADGAARGKEEEPQAPAPPAPLPALPEDRPVVDYDALLSRAGGPGEAPETGPPPLAAALVAGAGGAASSSAPAPPPDSGSGDEEPEDPGAEWWDKDEPTG